MAKFIEDRSSLKKKKKKETTTKKAAAPSSANKKQVSNVANQVVNRTANAAKRTTNTAGNSAQRQNTVRRNVQKAVAENAPQRYNNRPSGSAQPSTNHTVQDRLAASRQRREQAEADIKRRRQETEARSQRISQSRNPRMQDTARGTKMPTVEERRQKQDRLRQAQEQKMGNNSMASKEAQRTANRALKNTPTVAKESAKQVGIGHGKTFADITEANKSASIGSKIDIKSKEFQEDIEKRRKESTRVAKSSFKTLSDMQEKSEQKLQQTTKDAKGLEKAYYGALESGVGMATDRLAGPAWAVSMLSRTYGNTRGQAKKEGATEDEDRAYSLMQAAKEVATEYMFQGVGLAKGLSGRHSLSLGEMAANAITKNMRGPLANATHAGIRLLGGVGEENAEEAIGWGLDPFIKEFTYGRNVRTRQAQQMMREQSDALRSNITSMDDARAIAAYLGSDDFLDSQIRTYMDSGIGKEEARDLAENMRDYLDASLSGDTEKMADIEESLSKKLSGRGVKDILKQDLSLSELKDTIASTTLLTATTGLPGTVTTTARGAAIKEQLGSDGIRALAKTAEDFEDGEMQLKAKAMSERLDAGKDITNTQAYDLAVGVTEQYNKDADRQQTAYQTAQKTIKSEKLVTPYRVSRDGDIQMDEVTDKTYQSTAKSAKSAIETFVENSDGKESLTDTEIDRGSRAIAGFKTGVFTVDDANELNFRNTAVRSAFEKETGIDLNEYVVKGKDGQIDIPATNTATKNALFAQAADNLVATAQAETANWVDNTKGEVVTQISRRMGASGTAALQTALDDVDERDRSSYMMTANASDVLYQSAKNMGTEWENAKDYAKKMFPNVAEDKLKAMYEAGLADRDMATDEARGQQIKIGEKVELKKDNDAPTGQVIIETSAPVKGSVIRTFTELARNLGVDIHLVDHFTDKDGKVLKNVNGEYIDGNIFINVNSDFEKNMGFIFMHEVTHHLKMYAPEQYKALENLVREKWFKYDSAQMQSEIAKKIETYAKHGQTLTEEQALEEIIADAAHEFLTDRNFAREVANEDASLAQAVLTSIRNALRMLRRIMSADNLDETHMNTLFSQLDILDEAERLWLDAYKQAVRNNAAAEVDRLQNQIYEEGRMSVTDYSQEEMDAHRQALIDEMSEYYSSPYTDNYAEAGFVFPDGQMLRMGMDGQRGEDHRIASHAYDDISDREDALNSFINEGNIRWMPELSTMEFGISSEPTAEQYEWIRDVARNYSTMSGMLQGIREIDFTDKNGETVESKIVTNESDDAIVNTIKRFYKTGTVEGGSQLSQFRFSISDSDYMDAVNRGDTKSAQKMVDKAAKSAGFTVKGYHGTTNNFNTFKSGDIGFHFGKNKSTARTRVGRGKNTKIIPAWLSLDNPIKVDVDFGSWDADYRLAEYLRDEGIITPEEYQDALTVDNGTRRVKRSTKGANDALRNILKGKGYDGIEYENYYEAEGATSYIVFDAAQIKNAEPVTYDDNGDVIPLSERFNQSSPDIRYSIADTDSEGNAITEQEATVLHDIGPDVRFSMTTENEPQAKAAFRAGKGEFRGFKNEASGRELRTKLIKENFPEGQADAIVKAIDSFMDATGEFLTDKDGLRLKYQFIGWNDLESGTVSVRRDKNGKIRSVNFSAMKKNDEYPVNFDFSTVCNKRISFTKVIEEIAKAHDAETGASVFSEIKLTPDNMWKINEALKAEGIDTACLGCFVESRRYHIDTFFQNVEDRWNKPVREARRKLGLPEEDYFNFSKEEVPGEQWSAADDNWGDYGRAKAFKGAPLARTQVLMNEIVKAGDVDSPLLKLIRPSDLLTPEGFEGFRKLSNAKIDMVGQIKSMYGAGVPKEILGFTPYNSEIALLPKNYKKTKMEKYLKSIGGIRIQSFSDFMIEHVYDHFQLIADAAYRKLPIHAYTKVIAYAKIFGLTGAKINMSVMFDVKNSKQWAEDLGISEADAKQYADKYQGLRFVTETPAEYKTAYKNANTDEKLKKKYDKYISEGATEEEARRKTADWAVRPYRPITLEGKKGYLTYLVSDADYVNEQYQRMYNQYISEGLSEAEAERKANSNKPFEQSINYREAKALQDQDGYRENVGIIGVAFGDEHLRMMMDDENVRYIIPYHSSNLPVVVSNKTNLKVARDYSDRQNTYKAESWTIDGKTYNDLKSAYAEFKKNNKGEAHPARAFFADAFSKNLDAKFGDKVEGSNTGAFDVYKSLDTAKEISDVSERYLEDCIENNYIPVFHEFASSPGYYKMLFDFMVADDNGSLYPQHEVRNNYPGVDVDAKAEAGEAVTDSDLTELKKVIEEGAKAQNDKLQKWQDRKGNVMQDLLSREGEHSIIADSNINSVRYGTEDYTNPKTGEGIPKDAKLSISEDLDEPYMVAVNAGNMEEAQEYVDEAAKRAGMRVAHRYHGSMNANFTVFSKAHAKVGGNSGAGFYFSTNRDDSSDHYANVEGADNYFKWSSLADYIMSEGEWNGEEIDDYDRAIEIAKAEMNKSPGTFDVYLNYKRPYVRDYKNSTNIYDELMEDFDESDFDRDDYDDEDDYYDDLLVRKEEHLVGAIDKAVYGAISDLEDNYEILDDLNAYELVSYITQFAVEDESLTWETIANAVVMSGNEVDVINDDWVQPANASTELVRAIIENFGFDAVEDKEVSSKFGQLSREMQSDTEHIIVFKPEQIKLSDPVTYAEDGSVIPLSERFDPTNNDIRYSMSTEDADGNVLTTNQMEYFKNSQARDENGRLVPVYHTTRTAGFTVFDPLESDDHRSLFFTNSRRMSASYSKQDGRTPPTINPYDVTAPNTTIDDVNNLPDFGSLNTDIPDIISRISNIKIMNGWDEVLISGDDFVKVAQETGRYLEKQGYDLSDDFDVDPYLVSDENYASKNGIAWELYNGLREAGLRYTMDFADPVSTYVEYLNLENPLILDAQGHVWDDIPFRDKPKTIRNASLYLEPQWDNTEDGDPLLIGYTLSVAWEEVDDSPGGQLFGGWSEKKIETTFDNPDSTNTEWYPLEEMNNYAAENGLSASFLNEILSEAEENPMDGSFSYESEDSEEEADIYVSSSNTREIAEIAESEGYDGVIIRNVVDYGDWGYGNTPEDVYIAFSSNQVKDIRNENPTENPDIRYSITEDEIKSKVDYDHATDMSYEELLMYEDMISKASESSDIESAFGKAFDGEKVSNFYSALTEEVSMVFDDEYLEEGRMRMAKSKADFWSNLNTKWQERWETKGEVLDTKSVKTNVRNLIRGVMNNSNTDRQYKTELVNKTLMDMRVAYQLMKQDRTDIASALLYHSALRMISDVDFIQDDTEYQEYKGIRDYLRGEPITVGEDYWQSKAFQQFRKEHYGILKLRKGANGNIGEVYAQLENLYPHIFSETERSKNGFKDDEEDLLQYIGFVTEQNMQPFMEAYSSEYCADWAFEIADDLYEIMENGEGVTSLADRYKAKYDTKAKAMKTRHAEAILRVRKQKDATIDALKDRYNERLDRQKELAKDAIRKEREKFRQQNQAAKKKAKERTLHKQMFESIKGDYDWLTKAVLDPTKTKYIPEAFRASLANLLMQMDLETARSKQLEEKYGRVTNKTLKLRELRDRLNDMATAKAGDDTNLFDIDQYLPYLMDSLAEKYDGQPISALDVDSLSTLKILFKALRKNFQNLNRESEESKAAIAAEKASRIVEESLQKISRDGEAKTYEGLKGGMSTINMTALTPVYFFERMGTVNDIYKDLRGGFDTYIRNEADIMNKIKNIVGGYYKKRNIRKNRPTPGSELASWRDSRSAKEIKLTHGTVTMTVAQRMSFLCLANREQARKHMIKGGIVITPYETASKIEAFKEGRKGKDQWGDKVIFSADDFKADIDTIKASLTPEQIKVAQQLQQLMAVDMAKLGNEAHREMYGYEIFGDPDYFPIKSKDTWIAKDVNNMTDAIEKIKSFGPAKPLEANASNAIVVDDIFSVVADHCNGMNLYNAYLVPISNFMRVYNSTPTLENGTRKPVRDALEEAYGKKAMQYIDNFIRDLNGIKNNNRGGLEDLMNKAIGATKATAVAGNLRVAAQQPTAIVRAAAEMQWKYLAPFVKVKPQRGAMKEMFKYCPIAQWKSWGFYDTYMGRDIEDVMMNNWSKMDVALSGIYGTLDNLTWTAIWQGVKAEQHDLHPEMDIKSDEFLKMCGERASEIFDKTQVVDSTFHRSDAMRNKQVAVKLFTAFMSEPTLTLNVFRSALYDFGELKKAGKTAEANKRLAKALTVLAAQAALVSVAQALVDAWRGKEPGFPWSGDDDDEDKETTYWVRFLQNLTRNFIDQLHLENNMYLVKDVKPYADFMMSKMTGFISEKLEQDGHEFASDAIDLVRAILGWDQEYLYNQNNLVFASLENTANGTAQLFKKLEKGDEYDKEWYDILQKLASGISPLLGIPAGTLMRDFKPIWNKVFSSVFAADEETSSETKSEKGESDSESKSGSKKKGKGKSSGEAPAVEEKEEYSTERSFFGLGKSEYQRHADDEKKDREKRIKEAKDLRSKTQNMSASEKDKAIWDSVSTYMEKQTGKSMTALVESADYDTIREYRAMYMQAGGDISQFDARIQKASKTALKKTLIDDPSPAQQEAQYYIRTYLERSGLSDEEMSEIVYKTDSCKDLKVAFRMNDEEAINYEMQKLANAGMRQVGFEKVYKNRMRLDIQKYKESGGKYADRLKSMGNYIWPINGTITSNFGHRHSPGGIGSTNHQGLDIAGSMGQPVAAADGGVVIMAKWYGGAGKTVQIQHDDGTITQYSHLSWWEPKVGDVVAQGQEIGKVGSTGNSTGPHLHFGVMKNGNYVDPLEYLNKKS